MVLSNRLHRLWAALFPLLLAALALPAQSHAQTPPPRRKVIIDQDAFEGPGLQPILMLLNDPSVDVLGITTVSGDGWQAEETTATLRMLELIGRTDIPVIAGATFPLINTKERNRRREALYGALPYKGAWMDEWPSYNTIVRRRPHAPDIVPPMAQGMPTTRPLPMSAAEFMLAQSRQYPGQISIIAMGPLTNLALAARLDDGFAARIKEVITEGGNLLGHDLSGKQDEFDMQVAFSPRMSFNHFFDPEAAHIVFTAPWPRLTLVTNDATANAFGTAELLARATASGTPGARYVKAIAQPGYPLWDEIEAAVWLDPALVTRRGKLTMDIDLMPGPHYGALLTWPAGHGPGLGEREVEIVYAVDVARLDAMFVRLIGR